MFNKTINTVVCTPNTKQKIKSKHTSRQKKHQVQYRQRIIHTSKNKDLYEIIITQLSDGY